MTVVLTFILVDDLGFAAHQAWEGPKFLGSLLSHILTLIIVTISRNTPVWMYGFKFIIQIMNKKINT